MQGLGTLLHIGTELCEARLARGLTPADVAEATRIQAGYITAIETLAKSDLPSIGYVLGYVRTYADFLDMDGARAVARYKIDSEVPENLGLRDRPHFVPRRKIRLPRGFVPATTVMACAGMLAVWYGTQTETQAASISQPDLSLQSEAAYTGLDLSDPNMLTLKANAPSWVQIKDSNGQVIISRIFVTGETWQTPRGSGATISARDGGAIQLYIGEANAGSLGEPGVAFKDVPLAE